MDKKKAATFLIASLLIGTVGVSVLLVLQSSGYKTIDLRYVFLGGVVLWGINVALYWSTVVIQIKSHRREGLCRDFIDVLFITGGFVFLLILMVLSWKHLGSGAG